MLADGAGDGAVFSWVPAEAVLAHDVYLGTDFDGIDDGTTGSPTYRGRQDANSFEPGRLGMGWTYYWRIDEVFAGSEVSKRDIWSLTVEPAGCSPSTSRSRARVRAVKRGPDELGVGRIDSAGLVSVRREPRRLSAGRCGPEKDDC
jgi:hypothetical protein